MIGKVVYITTIVTAFVVPCALSFTSNISVLNKRDIYEGGKSFVKERSQSFLFGETLKLDNEKDVGTKAIPSIFVTRPVIHWTVPGYKIGWRDEEGNWFDEDGMRNGPPQNYWRQMSDERSYHRDMEAITCAMTEFNVEETVHQLERRLSARKPSLSKSLLGTWAPILQCGERITSNNMQRNEEDVIEVPYKINIFRKNGTKFGPKSRYGIFYARLEDGEELTIEVDDGSISTSNSVTCSATNEIIPLGRVKYNGEERPIFMGGITYISDYILIQRNEKGLIYLWMRCDKSYLGFGDEDEQ